MVQVCRNVIGPHRRDSSVQSSRPSRMFLARAARNIAFHSGLHRVLFYRYNYMFRPRELAFLVSSLSDTHGLPGPILESGAPRETPPSSSTSISTI